VDPGLYREDYSNVGVTLHFADQGVDTGNIVAQGFPQLGPTDTEATIQAECAKLASDLLTEFLHALAHEPIEGIAQTDRGHLYRFRDRTVRQDVHHMWRRAVLHRRPARREARVVRNF
jgi:methionyl-tRNA formyltransferase